MITVFASRKITLYSMIADINYQMNLLSQQRMNLASLSMAISDGQISQQEYLQSNTYVKNGINSVFQMGSMLNQQAAMMGQQTPAIYSNQMNPTVTLISDYALQQANTNLAAQEKALELKQKSLETKLSMYEKELETVESSEAKSIQRSTPKYTGVA